MFSVFVTKSFERDFKKVARKEKETREAYRHMIDFLEHSAMGAKRGDVKKLRGVPKGEGQWRIRRGNYRARYDVFGKKVILHTFRNRKDAYR